MPDAPDDSDLEEVEIEDEDGETRRYLLNAADKEARQAAQEQRKADREATRETAEAERKAGREARAADRNASKDAKQADKPSNKARPEQLPAKE